jgi:hypothetical protein
MTYSYCPAKIQARGKDQMRFELGDTSVGWGAETCALSDEEYEEILGGLKDGKKAWLHAKLYALEAIMFKLSYQVDGKIDVLSWSLGTRAEQWQKLYTQLRQQILSTVGLPTMAERAGQKPPYFWGGMDDNMRAKGKYTPYAPFRNMTE